jgi:hypothetical protein
LEDDLTEKLNDVEKDEQIIIAFERKRRAILRREKQSKRNSKFTTQKKQSYQTPKPTRGSQYQRSGRPSARQQKYRYSNQQSGRRPEDAMMVEDSIPEEFQGKKPFQTHADIEKARKSAKRSLNKFEKSRVRNSRSISRRSSSKMASQRKSIKRGASKTRNFTKNNNIQVKKPIQMVEPDFDEEKAVSVSEAISTSAFEYQKSVKSTSSFHSWEDTRSIAASFYSEHSIEEAKKEALGDEELLDLDQEVLEEMAFKSRSRDIRGNKIVALNGMVAERNEPTPGPRYEEDEESDIDDDLFKNIETNLDKASLHQLNKTQQYIVYNRPAQKKINNRIKEKSEKLR